MFFHLPVFTILEVLKVLEIIMSDFTDSTVFISDISFFPIFCRIFYHFVVFLKRARVETVQCSTSTSILGALYWWY